VPVVALTAFAMAEDRDRTLLDGFDGYLSKPISVRDLPHQVALVGLRRRVSVQERFVAVMACANSFMELNIKSGCTGSCGSGVAPQPGRLCLRFDPYR
jgi:DNA-binding response OmpR family regulator